MLGDVRYVGRPWSPRSGDSHFIPYKDIDGGTVSFRNGRTRGGTLVSTTTDENHFVGLLVNNQYETLAIICATICEDEPFKRRGIVQAGCCDVSQGVSGLLHEKIHL